MSPPPIYATRCLPDCIQGERCVTKSDGGRLEVVSCPIYFESFVIREQERCYYICLCLVNYVLPVRVSPCRAINVQLNQFIIRDKMVNPPLYCDSARAKAPRFRRNNNCWPSNLILGVPPFPNSMLPFTSSRRIIRHTTITLRINRDA